MAFSVLFYFISSNTGARGSLHARFRLIECVRSGVFIDMSEISVDPSIWQYLSDFYENDTIEWKNDGIIRKKEEENRCGSERADKSKMNKISTSMNKNRKNQNEKQIKNAKVIQRNKIVPKYPAF